MSSLKNARILRNALPYGKWTCDDGREVLFNRGYKPIWQRINGIVSRADSKEWVRWSKQEWFYDDLTSPFTSGIVPANKKTRAKCEDILRAWGVSVPEVAQ